MFPSTINHPATAKKFPHAIEKTSNEFFPRASCHEKTSATLHLLRRAASGIPRVSSILGGIVQELNSWEDSMNANFVGVLDGDSEGGCSSVGLGFASGIISDIFFPYLNTALAVLLHVDLEEEFDYDYPVKSGASLECNEKKDDFHRVASIVSGVSELSLSSPTASVDENDALGGLFFQGPTYATDDINLRLDYVVTQIDISRMARTASRRLDVESIDRLPTIIFQENDPLICPSNEGGDSIEDNLQGDIPLIENYFNDMEDNDNDDARKKQELKDSTPNFSWMVVPSNPKEDEVTRIPSSYNQGTVPESISICSSHHSNEIGNDIMISFNVYENCIICQDSFQDGDCLKILPCQHMFHCGCIDKLLLEETAADEWIARGCPMCKKNHDVTSQSHHVTCVQESPADTFHSDGSVPSWAFARLGDILSSVNDENHFANRSE